MLSTALSTRARRVLAGLVISLAVIAVYHNSLHGPLVFDDHGNITSNASLRQWWSPSAWFLAPADAGVAGRPLANFTLALNYALGGLDVRGYHALNLALHALTGLSLFGFVRRTLLLPALKSRFAADSTTLALAVAVMWLVHPLTTATVDYVSQRTELLAALGVLLTLYGSLRHATDASPAWAGFAVAACTMGVMSKETAAIAPVLAFLHDRTFVAGSSREAWRTRWRFYLALGATWLLLAGLMAVSRLSTRGVGIGLGVAPIPYAWAEGAALARYLKLAVWPTPLVFDYGWNAVGHAAASLAALGAIGVVAIAFWRRHSWAFAALWFFVALAPTSSFVPIVEQPIAENRTYLPIAAVVTLATVGLFALLGRRAWLALVAGAIACGTLTFQRNRDYADEVGLWRDTVTKRPQNARAHSNLAGALLRAGRPVDALAPALTAVRLRPDYADAQTNAGNALVQLERIPEALPYFAAALQLRPASATTHYNLANAFVRAGRNADAISHFDSALRLDPTLMSAHSDLGIVLQQVGRTDEAIAHGAEAIRLAPQSAEAHYNLGNALAAAGRQTEAIERLATAVRLQPGFAKAHNNLGVVLLRAGETSAAIAEFEAAVRLRPGYAEAERNLQVALRAAPP